jgi:hypothetical protein
LIFSGRIERVARPFAVGPVEGAVSVVPNGVRTVACPADASSTSTSRKFVSPTKSATKRLTGSS